MDYEEIIKKAQEKASQDIKDILGRKELGQSPELIDIYFRRMDIHINFLIGLKAMELNKK